MLKSIRKLLNQSIWNETNKKIQNLDYRFLIDSPYKFVWGAISTSTGPQGDGEPQPQCEFTFRALFSQIIQPAHRLFVYKLFFIFFTFFAGHKEDSLFAMVSPGRMEESLWKFTYVARRQGAPSRKRLTIFILLSVDWKLIS